MNIQIRNYKEAEFPQFEQLLKNIGIYYKPLDTRDILKKKIEHDPEAILVGVDIAKLSPGAR